MRRYASESGSVTVELVLLIPVLILMLWFLLFCGRMTDSRLRVEDAAHQAARAASTARTSSAAAAHAQATAEAALSETGVTCRSLTVDLSGNIQPGGTVTAAVTCRVGLDDLALLHVPGSAVLDARFSAPVDTYRGANTTPLAGNGAP